MRLSLGFSFDSSSAVAAAGVEIFGASCWARTLNEKIKIINTEVNFVKTPFNTGSEFIYPDRTLSLAEAEQKSHWTGPRTGLVLCQQMKLANVEQFFDHADYVIKNINCLN